MKFDESLLLELEELIDFSRQFSNRKVVPVIYDGVQYTVKIPKRIATDAGISGSDEIEFIAESSYEKGVRKTELKMRLVRG